MVKIMLADFFSVLWGFKIILKKSILLDFIISWVINCMSRQHETFYFCTRNSQFADFPSTQVIMFGCSHCDHGDVNWGWWQVALISANVVIHQAVWGVWGLVMVAVKLNL